jgi:hypothetical protein
VCGKILPDGFDALDINAERHDKRLFSVGKLIAIAFNASYIRIAHFIAAR